MSPLTTNPHDDGVACDLCGGRAFSLLHEWPVGDFWNPASIPIAVWRCESCGLVRLHPTPTGDQLPDAGDWWSTRRKEFSRRRWFKSRWTALRYRIVGSRLSRMIRATGRVTKSGRLLDVGCGRGELLVEAAGRYECLGLDPSPLAVRAARERGFEVVESTFEDAPFERESFDVVTMDSVIEHVTSPTAALAKVHAILRPGGIVVVATPKFGGPAYRTHGSKWNGFRHGYHRHLFTGATLGRCLEKTGFEVLRRPRRDRMLDDILMLWGRKHPPSL